MYKIYKDKCGTCYYLKQSPKFKGGYCDKKSNKIFGKVNLSKSKCLNYVFNKLCYCECNQFLIAGWNYCPNCGKVTIREKQPLPEPKED